MSSATSNLIWTQARNGDMYAECICLPACLSAEGVFRSVTKRAVREKVVLPPSMQDIRLHDVRRTFGSYQALTGASLQIIGRSLGHKSMAATQIYARLNLDPVRASIEKATEAMFQL